MSDTSGAVSAALSDGSPSTPESAQSALEALQSNAEWSEKFLDGDPAAAAKFHELSRVIAGAPPATKAPAEITTPKTAAEAKTVLDRLQNDPQWAGRFLGGDEAARREFAELSYLAMNGVRPAGFNATVSGMSSPRDILNMADALAELGFPMKAITEAVGGIPDLNAEHVAKANEMYRQATGDAEWVKRYLAGGYAERQLMSAISVIRSQWETLMREASAR